MVFFAEGGVFILEQEKEVGLFLNNIGKVLEEVSLPDGVLDVEMERRIRHF